MDQEAIDRAKNSNTYPMLHIADFVDSITLVDSLDSFLPMPRSSCEYSSASSIKPLCISSQTHRDPTPWCMARPQRPGLASLVQSGFICTGDPQPNTPSIPPLGHQW